MEKSEATKNQLAANRHNRKLAHGLSPRKRAAKIAPTHRGMPHMPGVEESNLRL